MVDLLLGELGSGNAKRFRRQRLSGNGRDYTVFKPPWKRVRPLAVSLRRYAYGISSCHVRAAEQLGSV